MEAKLKLPIIQKEYAENWRMKKEVKTFQKALEVIKSLDTNVEELKLDILSVLDSKEKKALRELPEAISSNDIIRKLNILGFKVSDILVAEAMRALVRKDNVTCIEFKDCYNVRKNQRYLQIMCQAFEERAVGVQLRLEEVSSSFLKSILEASYSKCFSLFIFNAYCNQSKAQFRRFFSRANLLYLSLDNLKNMKESIFLDLARCVEFWPSLCKLEIGYVPLIALKRLHGALKSILGQARRHMFERLRLKSPKMNDQLTFCYFSLLESDLINDLRLDIESDLSPAVVKSIPSVVANTKNLSSLFSLSSIYPTNKLKWFSLQQRRGLKAYRKLSKVNP